MDISSNSASQIATQGIQTGFERLAENSQSIITPTPLKAMEGVSSQTPSTSLETSLINNQQISTQIQSLAKVIKAEDSLIGQLFDDWA